MLPSTIPRKSKRHTAETHVRSFESVSRPRMKKCTDASCMMKANRRVDRYWNALLEGGKPAAGLNTTTASAKGRSMGGIQDWSIIEKAIWCWLSKSNSSWVIQYLFRISKARWNSLGSPARNGLSLA
jgi:hypothetical protein